MKLTAIIIITLIFLAGCSKKEETEKPEKYKISQTLKYNPAQAQHFSLRFSVTSDNRIVRDTVQESPESYTVSTRLYNSSALYELIQYDGSNGIFSSDIKVTNFDSLCIVKTNEYNKANEIKQKLLKFEDCK